MLFFLFSFRLLQDIGSLWADGWQDWRISNSTDVFDDFAALRVLASTIWPQSVPTRNHTKALGIR